MKGFAGDSDAQERGQRSIGGERLGLDYKSSIMNPDDNPSKGVGR
jgi:hypothetical protein